MARPLAVAVERHWNYVRTLQLEKQIVADVPVNFSVADLADGDKVLPGMLAAGQRLRDEFGARNILLGCAGMARYRAELQQKLQTLVIDPTQVAVAQAISALQLGYRVDG